jgi:coproporphyrinogen III oxidase
MYTLAGRCDGIVMIGSNQKQLFKDCIDSVQLRLTQALEQVDGQGRFTINRWERKEGGGGQMAVMRGTIVEKAGVNVSVVHGPAYPAIEGEHKGKPFSAMGVSTITHMANPHAPIGHMNIRLITVGDDRFWFGGGADLTPFIPFAEDTRDFHDGLRAACALHGPDSYAKYSKWCDEYFYIPHRQSIRGVGGVFFDYLEGDFNALLPFVSAVANAYVDVFPRILERRKTTPYTDAEKDQQLFWRGRYAEFNLAYDRGTRFGFMSGGNTEAILVSLPPVVKW